MENSLLFSEEIDCTVCSWSPDGLFLAHDFYRPSITIPSSSKLQKQSALSHFEIIIRDVKTNLGFFKSFSYQKPDDVNVTSTKLTSLNWSSDSSYIAAGFYEEGIIFIFCLDSDWKCKIDVGDELEGVGLIDFCWSPRSRHVLTTACDYIQLTIWPLCAATFRTKLFVRDIVPIKNFKDFSYDGSKLAIAQYEVDLMDIDGSGDKPKDTSTSKVITIYNTETWKPHIIFPIKVKDLIGLKWCPNTESNSLLLWDSALFSNFYIYSTNDGSLLKHISPDGLSPGIKTIEWSITGQILAFTNYRNVFRLVNGLTFGILLEETIDINLPQEETGIYKDCKVYVEEKNEDLAQNKLKYKYSLHKKIPSILSKDLNKLKTDILRFSWDGKYLAIYLQSFTSIIWIWDISTVKIHSVLIHRHSISDFKWDPVEYRLCVTTGKDYIYFWSPTVCYLSRIPHDDTFEGQFVEWNSNGSRLIVSAAERLTSCTFKPVNNSDK